MFMVRDVEKPTGQPAALAAEGRAKERHILAYVTKPCCRRSAQGNRNVYRGNNSKVSECLGICEVEKKISAKYEVLQ